MASPSRGAIGSRRVLHFVLTFDYIAIDGMGRAPMWVSSRNGVYFDTLLDAAQDDTAHPRNEKREADSICEKAWCQKERT